MNKNLQIIDFETKGTAVKFRVGCPDENGDWVNHNWTAEWTNYRPEPSKRYYGDDWDDAPYEHNAGDVYEWFEKGNPLIIHFPFDCEILEPCDGEINSSWCKDDMAARKVPCVLIVPDKIITNRESMFFAGDFSYWVNNDSVIKIYFGDTVETVLNKVKDYAIFIEDIK